MAKQPLPTVEQLRQLLRYDPETGELFWLPRGQEWFEGLKRPAQQLANCWNAHWAGKLALRVNSTTGYCSGAVLSRPIQGHRVIWSMAHGVPLDEVGLIDHIDGNKSNNRLSNLRMVSQQENCRNAKLYKSNTSGVPGVMWEESHKAWSAKINFGGRQRRIGRFKKFEDAVAARKRAEAQHGYHPNHGRAV